MFYVLLKAVACLAAGYLGSLLPGHFLYQLGFANDGIIPRTPAALLRLWLYNDVVPPNSWFARLQNWGARKPFLLRFLFFYNFCLRCIRSKILRDANRRARHRNGNPGEDPRVGEHRGNLANSGPGGVRCKSFGTRHAMSDHPFTHAAEKQYRCGVCGKGFARKEYRQRHACTRAEHKPYLCDQCGRGYRLTGSTSRGTSTRTRPESRTSALSVPCRSTRTRSTRHVLTHTGERLHPCVTCGQCFRTPHHLACCTRVHTDERPCPCRACVKSFS
ncbi:hypothetical protein MTO96_004947 [Rhipicephalus appendiculatus]